MLVHDVAKRLDGLRREVASCWECPISREPISCAVLASDGRIYERDSLAAWLEQCAKRREPYASPVTREAIRPAVCTLASADEAVLLGMGGSFAGGKAPDQSLARPQSDPSDVATTLSGSARCRHWNTRLGVITRMMLGWNDDDTVEWWFPVLGGMVPTIFTPATALPDSLRPVAAELVAWLGLASSMGREADPTHIFTAYARVKSQADPAFRTIEERLLAA